MANAAKGTEVAKKDSSARSNSTDRQLRSDQTVPTSLHPLHRLQPLFGNQSLLAMVDRAAQKFAYRSALNCAHTTSSADLRANEVVDSPGYQLDDAARSLMERQFGRNFADVRIHTDDHAANSARQLGARAFTYGRDVVFGAGQYAPERPGGLELLAHELAHVVQQGGSSGGKRVSTERLSALEAEADLAGKDSRMGRPVYPRAGSIGPVIQCQTDGTSRARTAVMRPPPPTASSPNPLLPDTQRLQLDQMIKQYRALVESKTLSPEEVRDVEQAIARANAALREAERVSQAGSTLKSGAGGSIAAAGVLTADDATGIGVADDVAIPFMLVAAGILGLAYLARRSSDKDITRANQTAREAVSDAIKAIGQVVLAQQVGNQVRGLTNQIVIHLARILGTAVGGKPPDHQEDPEKDRPHWWTEVKGFIKQIQEKGLSPKQLLRELRKAFTEEQLMQIREAIRRAAEKLGQEPPDFPPAIP